MIARSAADFSKSLTICNAGGFSRLRIIRIAEDLSYQSY